jgi:hypothetical protein
MQTSTHARRLTKGSPRTIYFKEYNWLHVLWEEEVPAAFRNLILILLHCICSRDSSPYSLINILIVTIFIALCTEIKLSRPHYDPSSWYIITPNQPPLLVQCALVQASNYLDIRLEVSRVISSMITVFSLTLPLFLSQLTMKHTFLRRQIKGYHK